MNSEKNGKLERYLKNAQKFLWGLPYSKGGKLQKRGQKETYRWLYSHEFKAEDGNEYKGSYTYVIGQMLADHGIETIINKLVIPRVEEELFSDPKSLDFLRNCWQTGICPEISFLDRYGIDYQEAYPFLEVNTQYKYVEKWGEFAGLWFEEIDPLQY